MKGIILAGGSGTRLYPATKIITKQLLPVWDKPMIYYPLSSLMLAGIREILIISTPQDLPMYKDLLGDGQDIGLSLSYVVQPSPDGLAQAFILGEEFIGKDDVCLILGDNIFYGHNFSKILTNAVALVEKERKSLVFGYYVTDPERYGVVDFDDTGSAKSIEEKPKIPKSNYAVVGLYFYTNDVVRVAKSIKPSDRGELEITTVNQHFLDNGNLKVEIMDRGLAWLDTGTHSSLHDASMYIKAIEERQGLKIGCIEEIAFLMKYIDENKLRELAKPLEKSGYGDYLLQILDRKLKHN